MKILLIHNTCAEYRIKWFQKIAKKEDTEFLFTSDFEYEEKYGFKRDENLGLKRVFLSRSLKGFLELNNILKNLLNYDFVMLPGVDTLREFFISNIVLYRCKKLKISTGYFWEKWEAPRNTQPVKRRIKNLLICLAAQTVFLKVDVIFAGGSKSREYFIDHGADIKRITILPDSSEVPNCLDVDIRDKYHIPKEATLILYFGRMMNQKGLDILIRAVAGLDRSYFLLAAGDGDFRPYCEELVEELKINNIVFSGTVDPKDRKSYFEQCDIFVFPGTFRDGRTDVWGLTLNEAMEFGKVMISTDAVGSAYDLIENGINGYRIIPENVDALRDAIINARKLNQDQVKICNDRMRRQYNYDMMANIFVTTAVSAVKDALFKS